MLSSDFLNSLSEDHQRHRHDRALAGGGVVYRVATTHDDEVIGFASGGPSRYPNFAEQNELYAIYLLPAFQRRGIGRRLFGSVTAALAASGRKGLYLTALSVNPNKAFYAKLGGVETDAPSIQLGIETCSQTAFIWTDMSTITDLEV